MPNRQHAGPRPETPEAPEISLAERARTLAAIGRIGTLATHSREFAGFPFGSMMPFAADGRGRPVFFISSLAMHTQNLVEDARSSLLITQPEVSGDPLAAARLTLIGQAAETDDEDVRELYLARHENARYWQDFADFAFYRLEVAGAYYIGGFGVMGWITAEEYAAAEPDPLAEAAPGIIQHMNADHADALRRIAAHDSGEMPDEARMRAIDRLGFDLRLRTGDEVHGRRIAFPREARDAETVRAVLIEMGREGS